MVVAALNRPSPAAVVDQRVHRFLEHPLFIADDNLRRSQVHETLEPVVPVNHTPVEVVQVAGGEAAAVQLDHGAKLGGQYRQDGQNHVLDPVAAVPEGLHHPKAFDGLLAPLSGGGLHLEDELLPKGLQVNHPQDGQNRLGAHGGLENAAIGLLQFPIARFGDELMDPQVLQLVDTGLQLLSKLGLFAGQLVVEGIGFHLYGHALDLGFGGFGGFRVVGRLT